VLSLNCPEKNGTPDEEHTKRNIKQGSQQQIHLEEIALNQLSCYLVFMG
jgi:hypothetical protein